MLLRLDGRIDSVENPYHKGIEQIDSPQEKQNKNMMKIKKGLWISATASCLLVLLLVTRAAGQEVILRNLIVNNDEGTVHLRFGLRTREPEELSRFLKQGTGLRLICAASMDLERDLWWNRELRRSRKEFLLRYHSLDDDYRLATEDGGFQERNADLESLLHKGWSRIDMYLGDWPGEYEEDDLALNLRVRLVRSDVPVWLKRTLFFWSWNVVPAKNYRIRFGG